VYAATLAIDRRLRRVREPLDRLDPNDGGDRRDLETAIGLAEVVLDGLHVETAGNLLGARDREAIAGDGVKSAVLVLVLEGFAFCLGAFQQGVGMAELIGECFVGEVVEAGCGIGIDSLGHGDLHSARVRAVANVSSIPMARLHYAANVYTLAKLLMQATVFT